MLNNKQIKELDDRLKAMGSNIVATASGIDVIAKRWNIFDWYKEKDKVEQLTLKGVTLEEVEHIKNRAKQIKEEGIEVKDPYSDRFIGIKPR